MVPRLVQLDQITENVSLITLLRANLSLEYLCKPGKRCFVVFLVADRTDCHHRLHLLGVDPIVLCVSAYKTYEHSAAYVGNFGHQPVGYSP